MGKISTTNMKLVKIASIGGIATIMMGYAAKNKIESNVKSAPFYNEALLLVRNHPAAVHLLGQPIKDGHINVSDQSKNYIKGNIANFVVPIRGPKQTGTMFISVMKEEGGEVWRINKVELEAFNLKDKRLVIKSQSGT
ncbi:uncharacterized protein [Euwallacea fornicatus]|uniref:uncharacterized protein n=1 Tax=Euwallacea fornicatus TaxID=995702 RepID=UPI00338D8F5E